MNLKPIDKTLLTQIFKDYEYYSLYKKKTRTVIDVPENYVMSDSTASEAIEVVLENIEEIKVFIPDVELGDYVEHILEQNHEEEYYDEIYRAKDESYSKSEVDSLLSNIVAGEIGDLYLGYSSEQYNDIASHIYEIEEYTQDEIDQLFDLPSTELEQLVSIINDQISSKFKLWSSDKVSNEIANAILSSNAYSDSLIGSISSISLDVVSVLPTIGESNIIYILLGTPNTLNVYSNGNWIDVGNLEVDFSNVYTKDETDTLLEDKADKTSTVKYDDIVDNLDTPNGTTVLSSFGLSSELCNYQKKVIKSDDTDCDNIVESGVYMANWTANYPSNASDSQGLLYVEKWKNADWVRQEFTEPFTIKRWVRIKANSVWYDWTEMATIDLLSTDKVVSNEINTDTIDKNISGWCEKVKGTRPKMFEVEETSSFWLENHYVNEATKYQVIISYDKKYFTRAMFGGTWSDWQDIVTSDNMSAKLDEKVDKEMLEELKILGGWTVPKECPIQNNINGNTFTQNVNKINLGSLIWQFSDGVAYTTIGNIKPQTNNLYLSGYGVYNSTIGISSMTDKTIKTSKNSGDHTFYIKDLSIASASDADTKLNGKYLYYEIETPIIKNLNEKNALDDKSYIANDWNNRERYVLGEIVFHNGQMWNCTQAHNGKQEPKDGSEYWKTSYNVGYELRMRPTLDMVLTNTNSGYVQTSGTKEFTLGNTSQYLLIAGTSISYIPTWTNGGTLLTIVTDTNLTISMSGMKVVLTNKSTSANKYYSLVKLA